MNCKNMPISVSVVAESPSGSNSRVGCLGRYLSLCDAHDVIFEGKCTLLTNKLWRYPAKDKILQGYNGILICLKACAWVFFGFGILVSMVCGTHHSAIHRPSRKLRVALFVPAFSRNRAVF